MILSLELLGPVFSYMGQYISFCLSRFGLDTRMKKRQGQGQGLTYLANKDTMSHL